MLIPLAIAQNMQVSEIQAMVGYNGKRQRTVQLGEGYDYVILYRVKTFL